jgi:peptidoglycan/xylan/chitin deacetylase (PgdA/CDA1 family)
VTPCSAASAGISWDVDGFETAAVDSARRPLGAAARFRGDEVHHLIGHLTALGRPTVVVDSTNGVLDGPLLDAGLRVGRADPGSLSDRPRLGSVPARELAELAVSAPAAVTLLDAQRGSLTGREAEADAWAAATGAALAAGRAAGNCLVHGVRHRPAVALTFDDGPVEPYTTHILDILERRGVRATFFCIGLRVSAHPGHVARMRDRGHAIGNHTWSHPFLPDLSLAELAAQVRRTQQAVADASGGAAPTLFRPPYGSLTPDVLRGLAELGLTIALWDVGSGDWARPPPEAIVRTVLDRARAGSVITLHDGGGDRSRTVAALPGLIDGLRDRGFDLLPVDEIEPDRSVDAGG